MDLKLGVFIVPDADPSVIEATLAAEAAGLDLVGIQDHPYQRRFHDTWTLISYLAGRTERIRFVTDVVNLPLRPPAVLAKSAASLDILSGGRFDLGLGAGGFWDGVVAMGGEKRTPKESVDALEEAIEIIRAFWSGERSVRVEGDHYRVVGAKPGPPIEHGVGLWIGAYGPRMLKLTGRSADGWLPSLGGNYLSLEEAVERQKLVDEGARAADRDPREIERAINVMSLDGEPSGWPEQLAKIADAGFETLLVGLPDEDVADYIGRLGEETAPRLRELVG